MRFSVFLCHTLNEALYSMSSAWLKQMCIVCVNVCAGKYKNTKRSPSDIRGERKNSKLIKIHSSAFKRNRVEDFLFKHAIMK